MKINKPIGMGLVLLSIYGNNIHAQDYVTEFKYDARGRLVKVSDDGVNEIYYTLDDAGNRINVSDTPYTPPSATPPEVTSFTGPSTVSRSGTWVTLRWSSTGTTHCALAEFGDYTNNPNLPTSGSTSIRINEDTAMTITCYNGSDSDSMGKLIRVDSGGGRDVN
jgi:YD repeat-containing protein